MILLLDTSELIVVVTWVFCERGVDWKTINFWEISTRCEGGIDDVDREGAMRVTPV